MYQNIIKHQFGQHYTVQHARRVKPGLRLEPVHFNNPQQAINFLRQLKVPHDYWEYLLKGYHRQSSAQKTVDIHQQASELLIQGKLLLFPVKPLDPASNAPHKVTIKQGNTFYRFSDASFLLLSNPAEIKRFGSQEEAEAFISELAPDNEKLQNIAQELGITVSNVGEAELGRRIAEQLVSGKAIIIVDKTSSAPAGEQAQEVKNDIGNRKAGLAGGAAAAASEEAAAEEEKPCTLHKYSIKCSHSRQVEVDPTRQKKGKAPCLQVVSPSWKADKNKQEKITVKLQLDTPCDSHKKEQVSVNNDHASFIGQTYGSTVKVRTPSEPFDIDTEFYKLLWLPSIKPTRYKISPSMGYCNTSKFDGKEKSVYIDSYPEIAWKLSLNMGYGKVEVQDEIPDDKNKVSTGKVERKIDAETFSISGTAECTYDNETLEFGESFSEHFKTIKSEMDTQNGLLSHIFGRFQEGDNHNISLSLPNVSFSGTSSIAERKNHEVAIKWDYTLKADPLFEVKAEADVLPMLIRSSGWGSLFLSLLKELKDKYANPDGSISADLEASIILSIAGKVAFDFNFTDKDFVEDKEVKPRVFEVQIPFKCEGKALAKGKVFVFSVELGVTASLSSGFGYKMIVAEDTKGIYRESTLDFYGLVFNLTAYIDRKTKAANSQDDSQNFLLSNKNSISASKSKRHEYKNTWKWMDEKTIEIVKTYIIES